MEENRLRRSKHNSIQLSSAFKGILPGTSEWYKEKPELGAAIDEAAVSQRHHPFPTDKSLEEAWKKGPRSDSDVKIEAKHSWCSKAIMIERWINLAFRARRLSELDPEQIEKMCFENSRCMGELNWSSDDEWFRRDTESVISWSDSE